MKTKTILLSALAAVASLGAVSCKLSSNPQAFGQKAETEVKKGMSMEQVKSILGPPRLTTTHNGEVTWAYQKINFMQAALPLAPGGQSTNTVTVVFGRDQKVNRVNNTGMQQGLGF